MPFTPMVPCALRLLKDNKGLKEGTSSLGTFVLGYFAVCES